MLEERVVLVVVEEVVVLVPLVQLEALVELELHQPHLLYTFPLFDIH